MANCRCARDLERETSHHLERTQQGASTVHNHQYTTETYFMVAYLSFAAVHIYCFSSLSDDASGWDDVPSVTQCRG